MVHDSFRVLAKWFTGACIAIFSVDKFEMHVAKRAMKCKSFFLVHIYIDSLKYVKADGFDAFHPYEAIVLEKWL